MNRFNCMLCQVTVCCKNCWTNVTFEYFSLAGWFEVPIQENSLNILPSWTDSIWFAKLLFIVKLDWQISHLNVFPLWTDSICYAKLLFTMKLNVQISDLNIFLNDWFNVPIQENILFKKRFTNLTIECFSFMTSLKLNFDDISPWA